MPANNFEGAEDDAACAGKLLTDPVAAPPTEIVENDVGAPGADRNGEAGGQKPDMPIVRRESADDRGRLLGDDASGGKRCIPPKAIDDRQRRRWIPRTRRGQRPGGGRSPRAESIYHRPQPFLHNTPTL